MAPCKCELNAEQFILTTVTTKVAHKIVGQSANDIQNLMVHVIKNINVEDCRKKGD
jgi:hypothetical protein